MKVFILRWDYVIQGSNVNQTSPDPSQSCGCITRSGSQRPGGIAATSP